MLIAQLFGRGDQVHPSHNRRHPAEPQRFRLEALETRLLLNGQDPFADYHAHLEIILDGQQAPIPANIGVDSAGELDNPHTHDSTGLVHIHPLDGQPVTQPPTVGDFFRVWRTNAGLAGNNPNAIFNQNQILDRLSDAEHIIQMFVNGVPVSQVGAPDAQFENYVMEDGDQIIITYDAAPVAFQPTIVPIEAQTLPAGKTLNIPLDIGGFGPPTVTVASSNPNVTAQVITSNPSLRLNVRQGGEAVLLQDFSLPDLNPASATFGQNIGPSFYSGKVSAFYYTDPG